MAGNYGKFAEIIKQERFKRQMSQEQFANFLGVTKQAISFYERGERKPKLITASMIAQRLGIPIEAFTEDMELPKTTVQSFRLSENDTKMVEFLLLLQKHADTIEILESLPEEKRKQALDFLRYLSKQQDSE